jgi:hypothetical protein
VCKQFTYQGQTKEITFEAIHIPDITSNLLSLSKLNAKGYLVEFGCGKATFQKPDGASEWHVCLGVR